MFHRRRVAAIALLATAALGAAGCGSGDAGSEAELTVTATTTQVADLVRQVGGQRVAVNQLLQPNSDPHGYEPRPSDVAALADSEVVFRSGGDLDDWLADVVDSAGSDPATVDLSRGVERREQGHGDDRGGGSAADDHEHAHDHGDTDEDPHWWQDPHNALAAVGAIETALAEADPDGAPEYEANAAAYRKRLQALDRAVAACIDTIPTAQRKLVTTHDSLGHYADRYGIEVVGALIPSQSTAAQPSARDTRDLVEQIRAAGVPAIFPESSLSPKLEQAVAKETGATVGGALWADSLGPEGSGAATYVDSIEANTEAIADGLGGRAAACDLSG